MRNQRKPVRRFPRFPRCRWATVVGNRADTLENKGLRFLVSQFPIKSS
nr:MAG TPA: hypothetical protein [Bacteriophage sp.]DAH05678.1 MAG TPA: hypothetical protein [Caudoviricetes sp.]DAM03007.1 MAG TPA: hypothetical protein [Caudoviricetes sp.]DAP12712.1 MAG TPA: hypothetical protein [Caudoviricetes sp.]DAZ02951.1 MAG TPA: hypothetical protein [Caudoviricetes sp.]